MTVEKILLTHGHIDHVGGAAELRDALGVRIIGPHQADNFLMDGVEKQAASYGLTGVRNVTPDRWLAEGDDGDRGRTPLRDPALPRDIRPAPWCS